MRLRMQGRQILTMHDLRTHFSLTDALRSHADFASFVLRHAVRLGGAECVAAMLFALYSLRQRGMLEAAAQQKIPQLTVPAEELLRLMDAPMPPPDKAKEYVLALVRCFTQRTETIRLFSNCGKSMKEAAAYCAASALDGAEQADMLMMAVLAMRIAGRKWEKMSPDALDDAMLNKPRRQAYWTILHTDSGGMYLAERTHPHCMQVHPAVRQHMLPEGCTLCTIRLHGAEQPVAVCLQAEEDGAALQEAMIPAGGSLLLDALQDAQGDVWALRIREGSEAWGERITGMAGNAEYGSIRLAGGVLDMTDYRLRRRCEALADNVRGVEIINVALRGSEVLLHLADGVVVSSYPSHAPQQGVLFLEDITQAMDGGDA